MNLYLDASFVRAEIAKLLEAYPDLADDETLRADTIEAETNAHRLIERALLEQRAAETMVEAIKLREAELYARRGRFERKSAAMKALIKNVMRAADLEKLPLPDATLSITKPRTSVFVRDVNELSQGFYRLKREPVTAAIRQALEAGDDVPGAELTQGEAGLMIRSK